VVLSSLNKLIKLQRFLVACKRLMYNNFWGMNIHHTSVFSLSARLDKTHPRGIYIDEYSYIAFNASILSHDMVRGLKTNTYIGKNCFIGAASIILPGVTVGDGSIVGAGSVVTKDVPPACIVVGNPARIVRKNIKVNKFGQLRGV